MKFVRQNVELINKNGNECTFKVNTSYSVYKELKYKYNIDLNLNYRNYISTSNKEKIKNYNLDTDKGILNTYNDGYPLTLICEHSKYSVGTIFNHLKKYGVEIRHKVINIDANHDYFKCIDSPEKAYYIGMFQTDGCVIPNENKMFITQKKEYSWYIADIMKNICYDVNLYNHDSCYQIRLNDRTIVNDLINIGLIKNKTYDQTKEDIDKLWSSIPEEYMPDFIRGLFDGDGWISFYIQKRGVNESCELCFCARNEHIVDLLNKWIYDNINYKCTKYISHNVWYTRIRDIKKIIVLGKILFKNFKYPYGHPKKAIPYLKHIGGIYKISDFGDPLFKVTIPTDINETDIDEIYKFIEHASNIENIYRKECKRNKEFNELFDCMDVEFNITLSKNDIECIYEKSINDRIHIQVNNLLDDFLLYFS